MKTTIALIFGLLAGWSLQAQPVSGQYSYSFSEMKCRVFDISGTFTTNVGSGDQIISLELTPRGAIRGTFSAHFDEGAVVLDLSGILNGKMSSAPPEYRIAIGGRGRFTGTAYGRPVKGSEILRMQLDLNTETGVATGMQYVNACVVGRGCQSTRESVTLDLLEADEGEGDWTLTLNTTNTNNRVTGTAQIALYNGRTVDVRVRGSYSVRDQVTRLQLRGTGEAAGVVLHLITDESMNLVSLDGKMFGQRVDSSAAAR